MNNEECVQYWLKLSSTYIYEMGALLSKWRRMMLHAIPGRVALNHIRMYYFLILILVAMSSVC